MAEQVGPEEFGEILGAYHRICLSSVQERHGYVAQFLGDGVLAYFGYPVAFEDSAVSAVHAALDILQSVRAVYLPTLSRLGRALEVRVGIHTGAVLLEAVGGADRRETLALGETPNIASRVQTIAAPGTVVITDATESCLRGNFELKPLGAPELKGISRPISLFEVARVRGEDQEEQREQPEPTPFVGRSHETAALRGAWLRACAGGSEIVLIKGEAGIGKSRQLAVLKESLGVEPHQVLEAYCDEHHQASALHPFARFIQERLVASERASAKETLQALERWADADGGGLERRREAALIARLLAVPAGDRFGPFTLTADETRLAMFETVSAWIAAQAGGGPTLAVLEDLHWADPSTMEFVAWRLQQPLCAHSLIILTARPEFQLPASLSVNVTELNLGALDHTDCARMVEQLTRRNPLPRQLVEQLVNNAAGVPLFVEETAKAVLATDLLHRDLVLRTRALAERGVEVVPTSLHTSITARLDRLGSARAVAQLSAVFGTEFRLEVFEAVLNHVQGAAFATEHYVSDLDKLTRAQILVRHAVQNETVYAFRHVLLRKAAYESLSKRTRNQYHRAIAETLVERSAEDNSTTPEVIAAHFSAAGLPDDALPYWTAAAERAMSTSAHVEAISHLNHALAELSELPRSRSRDRHEMLIRERLGLAHILISGFAAGEVAAQYSRALELCRGLGDEVQDRPEVLYGLWVFNFVRGDLKNTLVLAPQYVSMAQYTLDPDIQLMANAALGNLAFYRGDFVQAIERLTVAHQLSQAVLAERRVSELLKNGGEGLLYGALYLAWTYALCGERARALSSFRQALKLLDVLDSPYATAQAYTFGATVHRELGLRRSSGALGLLVQTDYRRFAFWLGCGTVLAGSADAFFGDAAAGIPKMLEGIGLLKAIGVRVPLPYHLGCLAEAQHAAGDRAAALASVDEAIELCQSDIDQNFLPDMLRMKAQIVAGSDPALAGALLDQSVRLSRAQGATLYLQRAQRLMRELESPGAAPVDPAAAATGLLAPQTAETPLTPLTLEEARELVRALRAEARSAP